jgi:hypothetical protein
MKKRHTRAQAYRNSRDPYSNNSENTTDMPSFLKGLK